MTSAIVTLFTFGGTYLAYETGRRQESMAEDVALQTQYQAQQAAKHAEIGKAYTLEQLQRDYEYNKEVLQLETRAAKRKITNAITDALITFKYDLKSAENTKSQIQDKARVRRDYQMETTLATTVRELEQSIAQTEALFGASGVSGRSAELVLKEQEEFGQQQIDSLTKYINSVYQTTIEAAQEDYSVATRRARESYQEYKINMTNRLNDIKLRSNLEKVKLTADYNMNVDWTEESTAAERQQILTQGAAQASQLKAEGEIAKYTGIANAFSNLTNIASLGLSFL